MVIIPSCTGRVVLRSVEGEMKWRGFHATVGNKNSGTHNRGPFGIPASTPDEGPYVGALPAAAQFRVRLDRA